MANARNTGLIAKAIRAEKKVIPAALQQGGNDARGKLLVLLSGAYPPPSAPGTPPHMRTGGYKDSFRSPLVNSTTIRLGTPLTLGIWLEKGTHTKRGSRKMEPRPHFVEFATTQFPLTVRSRLAQYMGDAARGAR